MPDRQWTVLCAGDTFISPELMEGAIGSSIGQENHFVRYRTDWPFEPSQFSEDIAEWSGNQAEVAELAVDAQIIVTHNAPIGRLVFEKASRLELVACCRGGPLNVDLRIAESRGVTVVNAPGRNAEATAEFTVGLLLTGLRRIADGSAVMRAGDWDRGFYSYANAGIELDGQTVGVIGFGKIGRRVAAILSAFGSNILVFDPYVTPEQVRSIGATKATLHELLSRSDVVTLHARHTPETHHLIDDSALRALKPGAYLVNTARGGLLDYDALLSHLKSGHVAGAALDVFPAEPLPPDHELRRLPTVILTPHIAGATKQAATRAANEIAVDVGHYCRGEPLLHVARAPTTRG